MIFFGPPIPCPDAASAIVPLARPRRPTAATDRGDRPRVSTASSEVDVDETCARASRMGYAGYAPGHRIVEFKTPFERALAAVDAAETLDVLEKLARNVARDPHEGKYRRVSTTSGTIKRLIFESESAMEAMLAMGWVLDGSEAMVLPEGTNLSMAHARAVDDARVALRRRLDEEMTARIRARAQARDPTRQALREQMEADRGERAVREPVTVGSAAVPRGESRVVTAAQVGASGSSGC